MASVSIGFDGTVDEAAMAKIFDALSRPVCESFADWRPTAVAGERTVSIAAGTASASFIRTDRDAPDLIPIPTPAAGQWFQLVARRDWTANTVTFLALPGATTSAATVPTSEFDYGENAAGFENQPGVLQDQDLGWAWVRNTDNIVRIWDHRFYLESSPVPDVGDLTLATVSPSAIGVAPNQTRQLVGFEVTLARPTKAFITYSGRWVSNRNAAGNLWLRVNGTEVPGTRRRAHNNGRTNEPFEMSTSITYVLPAGTSIVEVYAYCDSGSGSGQSYDYQTLTASEA